MIISTSRTLFLLLLFLPALLLAQRQPQRFRAGIVAGLTAAQIDGDLSAGYNKLGLQAGLRGITRLSEHTDASVEILYAQRGCQSELLKNFDNPFFFSLTLDYVEIPVQWHYKDWLIEGDNESENYYRVSFNLGLSYARLLNTRFKDDFSALQAVAPDYLKKNDISFLIGANFMANRHVGFTVRYQRSFGYMYDPRDWDPAPAQRGWNGHALYFQGVYLF